ncbi:zinc finger protein 64-like isoform X2 [Leguminivora glycinivorella]|uniref:zinc finger protein 64-like isoform X2 n=1 Tax=Leguminivora glycinivorella TaxID=1035111 RepID=UPI0020101089|nr:zinc finger protein 64-like isoform X2 [Leguminivora glycinivorella]
MEPYGSVPVFIDVERAPDRYILTQEMCHNLVQNAKMENSNPESQTFDPASQFQMVQNEPMPSQSGNQDMPAVSTQNEEGGQSEEKKPSLSGKPASEKTDAGLAPVPRRIRCPECQRYTAENEEKMLRHIKKVHKGENPFQCYMCDYSTYNKSLFEEHVRIHQGIKPFECSQCDYKSASKKNLKKHELIHRPNNPLKCQKCDFIARHSKALKRHEETHTDGDWLKFDTCKFQFQNMAAFKKHERTHKFKCKDCEFKTCSRPFLKRHMVKEHGVTDESVKWGNFCCQICGWTSSSVVKILLHLIHHPRQEVDESVIDISILKKHGIM